MRCPICGEAASWPIQHRRDPQIETWRGEIGDQRPYEWRLCRRCGNAFPSAQPDLKVLQQVWRAARDVSGTDEDQKAACWRFRRRISRIAAARSYRLFSPLAGPPGRFIDIACGLGETVRLFAEHGWQAEGIDADPSMEPLHRERGITTRIGQIETMALQGNYDLIHIAHAIYFITRSTDLLRAAREHLSGSGLLCVVISDFMSSVDADPPSYAHTFIPTGASMCYALALAGFETVLNRRLSGSIYLAARPSSRPPAVRVRPRRILLAHRTKALRHLLIGRPYLWLRALAKIGYRFFKRVP